jgi:hypothetical protein
MIPLISCERSDSNRYYSGTIVFHDGVPVRYIERENNNVVLQRENGSTYTARYTDLTTTIIEPFYDRSGNYIGHTAGRRTSRGIDYSGNQFQDIIAMLAVNDVPPVQYSGGRRINKDFRTIFTRGIMMLAYREELVGFEEDNVMYVHCPFILERLEKLNVRVSIISE